MVLFLLRMKFSPEQISNTLKRFDLFSISHETIYRHIWDDRRHWGDLHTHLRQAVKKRKSKRRWTG